MRAIAAAVLVLLVGGCTSEAPPVPRVADPASVAPSDEWIAADDDDAVFTVDCAFGHRASDDPIVHPGVPGASHSHDFFGSAATDASSTGPSLQGTPTTCDDADDTAAYWVPTLAIDGAPVAPTFLRAYYRAAAGTDVREVVAPPLGLAMIAGDPRHAHHGGGGAGQTGWGCGLRPRRLHAEPPTDCTDPSPLTLQLRFPDCWDGEHLDAPDHRAHVAPSEDGTCPAAHPVLMTQLQLSVQWAVTGPAAGRATLSSGPTTGPHGDFLNGWEPDALEAQIDLCIRSRSSCTIG